MTAEPQEAWAGLSEAEMSSGIKALKHLLGHAWKPCLGATCWLLRGPLIVGPHMGLWVRWGDLHIFSAESAFGVKVRSGSSFSRSSQPTGLQHGAFSSSNGLQILHPETKQLFPLERIRNFQQSVAHLSLHNLPLKHNPALAVRSPGCNSIFFLLLSRPED